MALPFCFSPTLILTTSNHHKSSFYPKQGLQEVLLRSKGNLPVARIKRNLPTAREKGDEVSVSCECRNPDIARTVAMHGVSSYYH